MSLAHFRTVLAEMHRDRCTGPTPSPPPWPSSTSAPRICQDPCSRAITASSSPHLSTSASRLKRERPDHRAGGICILEEGYHIGAKSNCCTMPVSDDFCECVCVSELIRPSKLHGHGHGHGVEMLWSLESRVEGGVSKHDKFLPFHKVRGSGPVDLFPDRGCRNSHREGSQLRAQGLRTSFLQHLGLLTMKSHVLTNSAISKSSNREISSFDPHSPTVYGLRSSHGWLKRLNIEQPVPSRVHHQNREACIYHHAVPLLLLRLADKTTVANATPVSAAQIFMRNPGFASAPVRKGIGGPQKLRAEGLKGSVAWSWTSA